MNQNLLIVDDEKEILSWLEELFRFEADSELGVYTAGSALEAVKLLTKVRFDVVLTDIRMPGMDGITLFRHIKENWPRCKTVFLTGYRNFEDIYQIINNQDVKYVLKSESDEVIIREVREFLNQSRAELEAEKSKKEQESWLEEAKYWLRQEFFNQLCSGETPGAIGERMEALGIPLNGQEMMLTVLLRIERDWKEVTVQDCILQEKALISLLQDNVPPKLNFYVHNIENGQELLMVQPAGYKETDWQLIAVIVQGAIEYVQEQFRHIYQDTISAVIAPEPVTLPNISVNIRKMKQYMVGYMGGIREVIAKTDSSVNCETESVAVDSASWVASLRNLMELGKKEEYFEVLRRYLRNMAEARSRHDTAALEIYYSVSIFLLQFINANKLNEQMAFRLGIYKLTQVDGHKSWVEAAAYLTEVSEAVFSLLDANKASLADHALKRVVAYICNHLDEDLSLTTLADVGGFNASYLSRLFKQIQKETISEFILHKRIELAKALLADKNEKIQDIAVKTGYLSPHSFTRAFRNEVGIAPKEYRELKMSEKGNAGLSM